MRSGRSCGWCKLGGRSIRSRGKSIQGEAPGAALVSKPLKGQAAMSGRWDRSRAWARFLVQAAAIGGLALGAATRAASQTTPVPAWAKAAIKQAHEAIPP